ncbi:MAG: PEP-CTERM system histidine kinase PrsK, partial [Burkholderiales bacterium]|nr:PEP-CTERM system histidine kinase PrsK [Burkholderiales bacterium]
MDLHAVDLATWSALLAALAYTALALRLLRTGGLGPASPRASLLFGAALVSSAAWGWAGAAEPYLSAVPAFAVAALDLLRYGCWFALLLCLLAPTFTRGHRGHGMALLVPVAALLVLLGLAALALGAPGTQAAAGWERRALFVALALPVFGLMLVEQLFRNISEDSRWNAKPLCLGLSVVFVFDLYLYSQAVLFGRPDADAASIRGAVHALAVPLLFVASRRRTDWIARLQLSRAAAFHSAALVLAGTYLLLVALIGYYIRDFGGAWGAALQLVALFAAMIGLVALAVSGSMRSRLRVLVGKHFYSYRYDYREEWLRFTAKLSGSTAPAEMGTLVIKAMADLVESPSGALWLHEQGKAEFVQAARWNVPSIADREPADSVFSHFLGDKSWVIDLEQCRARPEQYAGLQLPAWLVAATQFWLVIPLIVADELIGFIALGRARTPVDLDWEVTDLLKTASRQAAGFLAQMRATEALLEVRKFDAFNRMSAFVVHDLKNIVTQLSLMLKNAQRLRDNAEFQQDMLATVESTLEKMRQLMLQLREGKAPPGGHSGVELAPIVRRIEAVAAQRGRIVEVRVDDPVVTRGHEERIERVLGHVVQNALDATGPTDRVWLTLGRCSGQAQIEVGDTGVGMSPEHVQTRLFKPFHTTKETGMGIGSYESFQYVRELGGTISVDSELDRGTVMTIALPLFETHRAGDLQMS